MCSADEASRVTHSFKVVGGVLHRGFGVGNFVRSAPFAAGGHQWYIRYYPDGYTQDTMDYVSVFLEIISKCWPSGSLLRRLPRTLALTLAGRPRKKMNSNFSDERPGERPRPYVGRLFHLDSASITQGWVVALIAAVRL